MGQLLTKCARKQQDRPSKSRFGCFGRRFLKSHKVRNELRVASRDFRESSSNIQVSPSVSEEITAPLEVTRSKSKSTVTDVTLEFGIRTSAEWNSGIYSNDPDCIAPHNLMISYYLMKNEEGILCKEDHMCKELPGIVTETDNSDKDGEFLKGEESNAIAKEALNNILVETQMEHCGNNDETKEVYKDQLKDEMEIFVEETVASQENNGENSKDVEKTGGDSEANCSSDEELESDDEEVTSLIVAPLTINQNSSALQVAMQINRRFGFLWSDRVKEINRTERKKVTGENACAFLSLMMSTFILQTEQVDLDALPMEAERIITETPMAFNHERNIDGFYDGYSALTILSRINLIPSGSSLQELLIRNPIRSQVEDDLHEVLTRIYESEMRVACIFVCEPIIFTIFSLVAEPKRMFGKIREQISEIVESTHHPNSTPRFGQNLTRMRTTGFTLVTTYNANNWSNHGQLFRPHGVIAFQPQAKSYKGEFRELLLQLLAFCNTDNQRWLGIVETHGIPEQLGGNGGGLVLAVGGLLDHPRGPVTQVVEWVTTRLELCGISSEERTSLLSLYLD